MSITTQSVVPASPTAHVPSTSTGVLRLEAGDHLTRTEFERRYSAMPHLKKAELVDGVVFMPSPVSVLHGDSHLQLNLWLGTYSTYTPGVQAGVNGTVRLDEDNEPQPDVMLRLKFGGQSRVDENGYVAGAPELVSEAAASSASYDLHAKLNVYRRSGVQEYIVWRLLEGELDWFVSREGRFEIVSPDVDGIHKSTVFPGLWLDVKALLADDMPRVLAVLQQGRASPEHSAFVAALEARRKK